MYKTFYRVIETYIKTELGNARYYRVVIVAYVCLHIFSLVAVLAVALHVHRLYLHSGGVLGCLVSERFKTLLHTLVVRTHNKVGEYAVYS